VCRTEQPNRRRVGYRPEMSTRVKRMDHIRHVFSTIEQLHEETRLLLESITERRQRRAAAAKLARQIPKGRRPRVR
jgi:hypothetical protein